MPIHPNSRHLPAYCQEAFEAAVRQPLPLRWRCVFIHTYKPALDDASLMQPHGSRYGNCCSR